MKLIRAIITAAALSLLCVAPAYSQCSGQFPANTVCGRGATGGLPGPTTVSGGGLTPIAGGTVLGNPTAAVAAPGATATPILGIPGTTLGLLGLAGNTSGTVTVRGAAAAGTYNFVLPTSAGTLGQPLLSGGGGTTAQTYGTLQVPAGGTGLTAGTSGGVPYFNSGTTMASSAALAANQLVLGGGAGAAPVTLGSLGTTTTVLHGNAAGAPTFGAVSLTADVTGILPLANGGTNAALTASNGGLVYSDGSALAILAGTATAGQIPRSGASSAPAWSTATYPATAAAGTVLSAGTANVISATETPTLGANGGTGGQITLNGATSGSGVLRVAAAAGSGIVFQLPSSNGSNTNLLSTDGAGVTSWVPTPTGTVTSVSITAGTGITQSGSPITTSGAITVNIDKATAANYYAAASNKVPTTDIIYPSETTTTYGTTTTFDFDTFITTAVTLTGNITTQTLSNVRAGKSGTIRFIQDGTGSRTTVWNSVFKWASGTSPTLSTTASAVDVLFYQCISTTYCVANLVKGVA